MWRMDRLIRHKCGERKNIVGHLAALDEQLTNCSKIRIIYPKNLRNGFRTWSSFSFDS